MVCGLFLHRNLDHRGNGGTSSIQRLTLMLPSLFEHVLAELELKLTKHMPQVSPLVETRLLTLTGKRPLVL